MKFFIIILGFILTLLLISFTWYTPFLHTNQVKEERHLFDTTPFVSKPNTDSLANTWYDLEWIKTDSLHAAEGTKSVILNSSGTKLYAMNLEGLSVYEYDVASKKLLRIFKFKGTKGIGWDYERKIKIPSLREKPVEACLTHHDSILWVSLHNADGIVGIPLHQNSSANTTWTDSIHSKKIMVFYPALAKKDSMIVPLIYTGSTPKVIATTSSNNTLFVSNWHSKTISVLQANQQSFYVKNNLSVSAIPRGICVDDEHDKTYIAIMGGNYIAVINNKTLQFEKSLAVSTNPRHIVMDKKGRLYISFNNNNSIGCYDVNKHKMISTVTTGAQPRTIALSKNGEYLFATCYKGNEVDVFGINDTIIKPLLKIPCKGKPVGVDIREDKHTLEAWVCNYVQGTIKIFSFKKHFKNKP